MRRICKKVSVVLAAVMIAAPFLGCGGGIFDGKGTVAPDMAQEAVGAGGAEEGTPDYTTGTPWLDSNIDGNVTADTEISLKDDFYLAVNKDEILALTYEPGSGQVDIWSENEKNVDDNMMALITDESFISQEAEQLRAYYHALDDWETREPLARELLQEHLDAIDGIRTMKDYYEAVHDWGGYPFIVFMEPARVWSGCRPG